MQTEVLATSDDWEPDIVGEKTKLQGQYVAVNTFGVASTYIRKKKTAEAAKAKKLRYGFYVVLFLAIIVFATNLKHAYDLMIFRGGVNFYKQHFGLCSSYNVSLVNRSSGGDANCFGIPSVLCGNNTCEDVVQFVKPAVLCEVHRTFHNITDHFRNCTPHTLVYTCTQLSESTLPCSQDFVIEQFDYHTQFHCLHKIAKALRSTTKVPPIHHQVWFYDKVKDLEFHEYVAILSHLRFFQPQMLFIWNNGNLPRNKWWQELIAQHNQPFAAQNSIYQEISETNIKRRVQFFTTKIYSVYRNPPLEIYGMPIDRVQHKSDVTRLEAMLMFGGFYADVDTISLRSHKPLMQHSITMSLEGPESLTNMAIFAEPQSPHLFLWHYSYASFDKNAWSEWSIQRNFRIARRCPHLMYKEPNCMVRPNWDDRHLLNSADKNISLSHTLHLYWGYLSHDNLTSPEGLLLGRFMAHRIFRGIYYGLCDVCG